MTIRSGSANVLAETRARRFFETRVHIIYIDGQALSPSFALKSRDKLWRDVSQLVFFSGEREKVAGVITALKFQQHNKERVNVYLDGEYAFGLAAIEAARLSKGQVLSDAEIATLKAQDERHQAFDRAVRFLSYRPRSQVEVERYLRGKGVAGEAIADVIQRLEQANYLNDEAFARFWVENREQFKPRSRRALGYELRQKGVSNQIIARVLNEVDDEAAAWRAAEGRLPRWAGLPHDELRQKMTGYLSRRGFNYETITLVFERVCQVLDAEE